MRPTLSRCELPGGAWHEGARNRIAWLRALDGQLERALGEAAELATSWPAFVSAALTLAVERIGERPVTRTEIDRLGVADRQFLLLQLARAAHGDVFWVTARCASCSAQFELCLDRSELPIKPAGAGYPFAEASTGLGRVRVRVPDGGDQLTVQGLPSEAALDRLAMRCLVAVGDAPPEPGLAATLAPSDLDAIDAALDEVSAAIGVRIGTQCPECGRAHEVEVDPFGGTRWGMAGVDEEIHTLAWSYHWSEAEILSLPRARRLRYLGFIRQQRRES